MNISDQIKCVNRELRYRVRVYPRLVEQGKMTQHKANYELEAMQAVLDTLKEHARSEQFRMG